LADVEMVIPFGNTLHVCGRSAALLEERLRPFRDSSGYQWELVATGLEEVFISLMQGRGEQDRAV
jgi:ABC-2 type transport system ATP-binding protein